MRISIFAAARVTAEGDGIWPQPASLIRLDGRADEQVKAAGVHSKRSEGGEETRRRAYLDRVLLLAPWRPHGI